MSAPIPGARGHHARRRPSCRPRTPTTGKLQRAAKKCFDLHEADGTLPTNNRFIFYELEHEPTWSARSSGRSRRAARWPAGPSGSGRRDPRPARDRPRHGGIPWWWIEDETRSVNHVRYAKTVADYIDESVDRASLDRWDGKPPPLVLCESRSLAGVLMATADDYNCPISSTNGQVRGFLVTDVAPMLRPGQKVLYFGDLDLSAGHIEAHTHKVLRKHAPLWHASEVQLDAGFARPLAGATRPT